MKIETVTIIVPVYNVEAYLPACLDSLQAQTYPNLQIILVDDGSRDASGQICDAYALRDSRFLVIHQQNAGAANAKNAGLEAAAGDYIAFADSDDWVEPDWIEKLLAAVRDNDADVAECSFLFDYVGRQEPGNDPDRFVPACFETQAYLQNYPWQWTCALFWNKLFRAKLLAGVRFRTERRCIDDEFFTYKAVTGANRVVRIPAQLYHYRQRRSSVTQTPETLLQRTADALEILAERHRWMKVHYPQIALDYLRHDVDSLLYFAKAYPFHEEAAALFRRTARYYLRECLLHFPGKVAFFYGMQAFFYPKNRFLDKPAATAEQPAEEYYP